MNTRALFTKTFLMTLLTGASLMAATPAAGGMDVPSTSVSSVIATGTSASQAAPLSQPDLLARVKEANEMLYSNLQSFVCNEQMERFKGSVNSAAGKHLDTVTAKVSFESGVEHYSDIFQDRRNRPSIASVAGAWSEGEFGTLLQQTQVLLNTEDVIFKENVDLEGSSAALYQVQVSEANSPWDLTVDRQHYRIPFRTDVWVSRSTGQILQIERVSSRMPSAIGISEIRWGVKLQQTQINDHSWLLPQTGSYEVRYSSSDHREFNRLSFSNYRRYGAESALIFK